MDHPVFAELAGILRKTVGLADAVANALYPAQTVLQREINPKVFGRSEWLAKLESQSVFVQEIVDKPRIFVIGTQHDLDLLGQSAEDRAA